MALRLGDLNDMRSPFKPGLGFSFPGFSQETTDPSLVQYQYSSDLFALSKVNATNVNNFFRNPLELAAGDNSLPDEFLDVLESKLDLQDEDGNFVKLNYDGGTF